MSYAEQTVPVYAYPPGAKLRFGKGEQRRTVDVSFYENMLVDLIDRTNLRIADYFERMDQNPFFLLAATGLGKTVGVPTHILLRGCERHLANVAPDSIVDDIPRVWVVVPRIMIAEDLIDTMNSMAADYWRRTYPEHFEERYGRQVTEEEKAAFDAKQLGLYGCITGNGPINPDAPIVFITTGLLWIKVKSGELIPGRDRIVIDEAHVTIEQAVEVELAIALAKQLGLTVDYMSATVDTEGLEERLQVDLIRADQRRYPIWMHNLRRKADDGVLDLVRGTIIAPDPESEYFPKPEYADYQAVLNGVLDGKDRARGLLIMVNSYKGPKSDINRLKDLLEAANFTRDGKTLRVFALAGEIMRNQVQKEHFFEQLQAAVNDRAPFVIIATSVIEMGITIPNLDFVATVNSGFREQCIDGQVVSGKTTLGINALLQRVGRVGRKWPGIAYIFEDVESDYATLDDATLNRGGLVNEPIRFPLAYGPVTTLAIYLIAHEARGGDVDIMSQLDFPSRCFNPDILPETEIHIGDQSERVVNRLPDLVAEQARLIKLGIFNDPAEIQTQANLYERWAGQYDLAYVQQLQDAINYEEPEAEDILFWLVVTACSKTGIGDLTYGGKLPRTDEAWANAPLKLYRFDELVALYQLVQFTIETQAKHRAHFEEVCDVMGFIPERLEGLVQSVQNTLDDYLKNNRGIKGATDGLKTVFGRAYNLRVVDLDWPDIVKEDEDGKLKPLETLVYDRAQPFSRTVVRCHRGNRGFEWQEVVQDFLEEHDEERTPTDIAVWRYKYKRGEFVPRYRFPSNSTMHFLHRCVCSAKPRVRIDSRSGKPVRELIHYASLFRWKAIVSEEDEEDDDEDNEEREEQEEQEQEQDAEEEDDDDEDNEEED